MAIVTCKNGHVYDNTLSAECPFCKPVSGEIPSQPYPRPAAQRGTRVIGPVNFPVQQAPIDPQSTRVFYNPALFDREPVAGWLIRMTGSERGKDYPLSTGKTVIGNPLYHHFQVEIHSPELQPDEPVGVIAYFAQENCFYFCPTLAAQTVCRVNGHTVFGQSIRLQDYDSITFGNVCLVFLSFCNESFRWDGIVFRQ